MQFMACVCVFGLDNVLQSYMTDLCEVLFVIFWDPVPMLSTDDRMKMKKKRESLINSCGLLVFFFNNFSTFSLLLSCEMIRQSSRGQEMTGLLARLSKKAEYWVMAWKPQLSLSCKDEPES